MYQVTRPIDSTNQSMHSHVTRVCNKRSNVKRTEGKVHQMIYCSMICTQTRHTRLIHLTISISHTRHTHYVLGFNLTLTLVCCCIEKSSHNRKNIIIFATVITPTNDELWHIRPKCIVACGWIYQDESLWTWSLVNEMIARKNIFIICENDRCSVLIYG